MLLVSEAVLGIFDIGRNRQAARGVESERSIASPSSSSDPSRGGEPVPATEASASMAPRALSNVRARGLVCRTHPVSGRYVALARGALKRDLASATACGGRCDEDVGEEGHHHQPCRISRAVVVERLRPASRGGEHGWSHHWARGAKTASPPAVPCRFGGPAVLLSERAANDSSGSRGVREGRRAPSRETGVVEISGAH